MEGNGSIFDPAAPSTQTSMSMTGCGRTFCPQLEPGRKLQMQFLTEAYQVGRTQLREALNQLTAQGLVDSRERRGCMAPRSAAQNWKN